MIEGFTIAQFMITLFGMVGTVGAAIAAWFSADAAKKSLDEQSESNKQALKPHLVLGSQPYNLSYNLSERFFKLNWETGEYDLKDIINATAATIDLVNISNGIAKDVDVEIRIKDADKTINSFKENLIKHGVEVRFGTHPTFVHSKILHVNGHYENGHKKHIVVERYRVNNFIPDNFLFIEASGGIRQLRIPTIFVAISNFLIGSTSLEQGTFPELEITLKYKDIVGNCYENTYKLWVKRFSKRESRGEEIQAQVEFGFKEI